MKLTKDIFYNNNKLNKNKLRENWIKKNYPNEYNNIINFCENLNITKFSQKIYHYINNIKTIPKCKKCKINDSRFNGFNIGYDKCCSKSCASKYSSKKGYENRKKNTIKKYNVEHTSQLEIVKVKIKKTNLKRYGVEYPQQTDKIKEKIKKTINTKYGVNYPLQNKDIFNKMKNTILEKYGVSNIRYSKEIINKIKKTNLNRYNNEWSISSEKIKEKIHLSFNKKRLIELKEQYKKLNIIDFTNNNEIKIKCDKCNKIYFITSNLLNLRINRYNIDPCLHCNPLNNKQSSYERELVKHLSKHNIKYNINDRKIINPYEIDIYLPDYNIAFEINGLYWHSELFKDKNYHLDKTNKCLKKGIHLIHIWEDEWLYKNNIIISMINNILKLNKTKIYARNTIFKKINNKEAKNFLIKNHLQGYIPAKWSFGLYYKNEIISVMTFSKTRKLLGSNNNNIELLRFCNKLNTNVIGGASKLFKNSKIYFNTDIISYAKQDWVLKDNNIYNLLNFKFIHITKPGYYWTKQTKRYHRYNFRKDKLIKYGYNKKLTETQIMNNREYYKIYDTGNLKYLYKNKK